VPVPEDIPWEVAGGFPEAFTTAHDALFTQAGLAMGERVCIHGAAGGVGSAAVQLAARAEAHVVATVRNHDLRGHVAALGTGQVDVVDPEGFGDHGPFDVILELIGGSNLDADVRALATGGRIAVIGVAGGGANAEVNLLGLMSARGRIHGSTLRARPLEGKAAAARAVEAHVLPLLADGRVHVPVAATFPMSEAAAAYERFQAGAKFGKVVLLTDT
jgi:NADPH:quinone reductase